jgi:ribosomal protein S12 methylthiotransferase
MEKVHLLTLGCPKNLADSELMLGALTSAGFEITLDPDEAQVLVVNTCAFIEAAKKESIDAILEAGEVKRRGAGKRLVVAGCLSQRYAEELADSMPEVDVFVGTGNFLELPELLRRTESPELRPIPYAGAAHLLPSAQVARVKTGDFFTSYLKISEGCNHKCAFCIIPKIRGLHESRPTADLVAEAHNLVRGGVRELNLIAQDLTAYGRDLKPASSLANLLAELSSIDDLRWIRLLYCYPNFVTDELLDAIASLPKVLKYIDIPLQHADDAMLRAMRRERSGGALRKLLERIRARIPGVVLRTSFIVGFPGETDAAFGRLKDLESRNLVVPVVGDFAGPKAIRAIATYLKSQGGMVGAFYLSNVEQYLYQDGKWDAFCGNFSILPLDPSSTFIRSSNGRNVAFGVGFVNSLGSMVAEARECRCDGQNEGRWGRFGWSGR